MSLSLEYAGTLLTRSALKDFWKGGHHGIFGNVHFSLIKNMYTNLELFGGMGYSRYSANYRAKGGPVAATNETFAALNGGASWTQAMSRFLEVGVRASYVRHGEGRVCVGDMCRDGDTTGLFRTLIVTGLLF